MLCSRDCVHEAIPPDPFICTALEHYPEAHSPSRYSLHLLLQHRHQLQLCLDTLGLLPGLLEGLLELLDVAVELMLLSLFILCNLVLWYLCNSTSTCGCAYHFTTWRLPHPQTPPRPILPAPLLPTPRRLLLLINLGRGAGSGLDHGLGLISANCCIFLFFFSNIVHLRLPCLVPLGSGPLPLQVWRPLYQVGGAFGGVFSREGVSLLALRRHIHRILRKVIQLVIEIRPRIVTRHQIWVLLASIRRRPQHLHLRLLRMYRRATPHFDDGNLPLRRHLHLPLLHQQLDGVVIRAVTLVREGRRGHGVLERHVGVGG